MGRTIFITEHEFPKNLVLIREAREPFRDLICGAA